VSDRAWLLAICLSELGTMLVFSSFSALLPTKEFSPRKTGV
jgi:hypothetical protein